MGVVFRPQVHHILSMETTTQRVAHEANGKQTTQTVVCPECGYRARMDATAAAVARFGAVVFGQCNPCELEMARWYAGARA